MEIKTKFNSCNAFDASNFTEVAIKNYVTEEILAKVIMRPLAWLEINQCKDDSLQGIALSIVKWGDKDRIDKSELESMPAAIINGLAQAFAQLNAVVEAEEKNLGTP